MPPAGGRQTSTTINAFPGRAYEIRSNCFCDSTYRLRDVPETIETYDEHFWSNGHSTKIMVFDDSSYANTRSIMRCSSRRTVNELYYVGPREKE